MASFGGEDAFTPADQITALEQGLTAAGVENDVKVYEGAGHGFFNSGGGHHEAAAADSWDRALSWFGRHLS
jgi:carboxymethylenebutenolidase